MTNEELLKVYFTNRHILQSRSWGQFKTLMGTKAIISGKQQMTIHKLPLGLGTIGYAPKIQPEDLDLDQLYKSGRENGCIFIKLDVPHAPSDYIPEAKGYTLPKGKSVFARSTILMDLTKSDDDLLTAMHEKARYNLRLAQKKGVTVKSFPTPGDFSTGETRMALAEFVRLQKETARRQKFFIHPDRYYQTCFETLASSGMAFLIEAKLSTSATIASWFLFRYGDVLYYPYGESNYEYRAYMPSNLLLWEAVQLGKKLGCKVFDLWGAANDPNDENDPWHGFTRFKLSFGGLYVKLASTYDLVINQNFYKLFDLANELRWRVLRLAG